MPTAAEFGKQVIALTPKVAPIFAGGALRWLLDASIDGFSRLPGARSAAAGHLKRTQDQERAISALVTQHVAMAGAQGFVTNLGGALTAVVTVPANIAGAAIVQCRLVAAIAHLRGYSLDDNRVRSAILMCLLGQRRATELVASGELPSTPLAVATAPAFDAQLDLKISQHVMKDVMTAVTGKRLGVFVTKRVPVIGGGVGLAVDGWATRGIAKYALSQFPSRRVRSA